MAINGVFAQQDLLGAAMQTAVVRNDVISNNIANAETPGFKKRDVRFEEMFAEQLGNYRSGGKVDFSRLEPLVMYQDTAFKYRLDENNVDIEEEMVNLYENSVKYEVLAGSVSHTYKTLNLVISGIR